MSPIGLRLAAAAPEHPMRFHRLLRELTRRQNPALALVMAAGMGLLVAFPGPLPARDKKAEDKALRKRTEEAVTRGLEWLKKTQSQDGHWEAQGGAVPDHHDRHRRPCAS